MPQMPDRRIVSPHFILSERHALYSYVLIYFTTLDNINNLSELQQFSAATCASVLQQVRVCTQLG